MSPCPQNRGDARNLATPIPPLVPVMGPSPPTGGGAPGRKSEDHRKCPAPRHTRIFCTA
jgi:hypothetical protein